jgi:hypothetical protein
VTWKVTRKEGANQRHPREVVDNLLSSLVVFSHFPACSSQRRAKDNKGEGGRGDDQAEDDTDLCRN